MTLISTRESREGFSHHLKDNKTRFPHTKASKTHSRKSHSMCPHAAVMTPEFPKAGKYLKPIKIPQIPSEFGQGAAPKFRDTPGNIPISACHPRKIPGLEVAPPNQALLLLLPPTGQKSPQNSRYFALVGLGGSTLLKYH